VSLPGPLSRGQVQRALTTTSDPGGKGVNVARVVTAAGQLAVAVLPGHHDDPLLQALRDVGLTHRALDVRGRVRVNLTLTEPDGTTTKVNEPGLALDAEVARPSPTSWCARPPAPAGSRCPARCRRRPGRLVRRAHRRLRATGAKVALDTSGEPLLAALAGGAVPDLVKPNGEELAELTGQPGVDLESDPAAAVAQPPGLLDRGIGRGASPRSAPPARCSSPARAAGRRPRRRSAPQLGRRRRLGARRLPARRPRRRRARGAGCAPRSPTAPPPRRCPARPSDPRRRRPRRRLARPPARPRAVPRQQPAPA
jgi:1-phosphofructokinase